MKKGSLFWPLSFGAAVLVLSLFGVVNLTRRPGIRPEHLARPVVGVDGHEIRRPADVRFVLTRKRIGDPIEIRFGPDGGPAVVRDTVVPFYERAPFPFPFILLGGFSFLAGFIPGGDARGLQTKLQVDGGLLAVGISGQQVDF